MLKKLDKNTVNDYFTFCRDITVKRFKEDPIMFDAPSEKLITLQTDESIFGKKCKYNRGKPHKR